MLRRVRITGYKSLRDVEVRFDGPLSVIIGPNASGKSNLFDALALLSRMVTKRTLREAFDEHRGSPLEAFSFDEKGIEGLLKQFVAQFSMEVDFEISPGSIKAAVATPAFLGTNRTGSPEDNYGFGRQMRYSITIQINPDQGVFYLTNERLAILTPDFTERAGQAAIVERDINQSKIAVEGEKVYGTSPMSTVFAFSLFADQYPIRVALHEMASWRFYELEPRALREPTPLESIKVLGPHGEGMTPFFYTLKFERPKHFESIRRALHTLIPEIERVNVEQFPDATLHLTVTEGGTKYFSRVISAGTLRVLGLLAATNPLEPVTLLGIEEPENGVHPRRLEAIASLLKSTAHHRNIQVLVTTHSPVLPEYFSEDELIVCRRAGVETVFERLDQLPRDPAALQQHLNGNQDQPSSLTERIVRGDYGG